MSHLSEFQHIMEGPPTTMLVDAVEREDISAVRDLLSISETDVNQESGDYGRTALHVAVQVANIEILKLILEHPNVNVNKPSNNGEAPLYWAAFNGDSEVVRILLRIHRNCTNSAGNP
eukprot:681702_1